VWYNPLKPLEEGCSATVRACQMIVLVIKLKLKAALARKMNEYDSNCDIILMGKRNPRHAAKGAAK
jgi:hypothetical protein